MSVEMVRRPTMPGTLAVAPFAVSLLWRLSVPLPAYTDGGTVITVSDPTHPSF